MSEIAELREELAGVNARLDSLCAMIRGIVERPADNADRLLTVKQAADRLGCSQRAVYRLIEAGKIPFVMIGRSERSKRIRPDDLRAFERQQTDRAGKSKWPKVTREMLLSA
jgi:excisionase family DNA binding protein